MAVDYDSPRRHLDDAGDAQFLLVGRPATQGIDVLDVDDADWDDLIELPGADLSGIELEVRVLPKQADEFTCSRCYLVSHRSRLARVTGRLEVCRDCA